MQATNIIKVKLMHSLSITAPKTLVSIHSRINFQSRNFASSRQEKIAEKLEELKTNWIPIYRFPKIKGISLINKLKNYQLVASAAAIPTSFFAFPDEFLYVLFSAVALSASLSFGSFLVKDSIGFIYVHKNDKDLIRIAYLNFWGLRKDVTFKISEIVPFSELPKSATDKIYTKLKFTNGHKELKLLSRSIEILEKEKFVEIFGDE